MADGDTEKAEQLLKGAYAIQTADDSIGYYEQFAPLYDQQFADRMGYIYPETLIEVYGQTACPTDLPVLDIGCGTGLVATELTRQHGIACNNIDGVDISPDMLAAAKDKNLYNKLFQADLTDADFRQSTSGLSTGYGAIVSAGTFTFGHLGPSVLSTLLALGKEGTLYCIGVNSGYYQQQGFKAEFDRLANEQLISPPEAHIKEIYQPGQSSTHSNDTATIIVYRQLASV